MNAPTVRLTLRLARRQLARHPGRSALVAALVMVPCAVMTVVLVAGPSLVRTSEQDRMDRWGAAEASTTGMSLDVASIEASLPGARAIVERSMWDRVVLADRRETFAVSDLEIDHPVNEGRFSWVAGRAPAVVGEVTVTEQLADDLALAIGDVVASDRGGPATVVGIVEARSNASASVAYVTPERFDAIARAAKDEVALRHGVALIDLPPGTDPLAMADAGEMVHAGVRELVQLEPLEGTPRGDDSLWWTYAFGGAGLAVLATVVAAAFAVGARRQLAEIGVLGAAGAPTGQVAAALATQGLLTGAAGAVAGVALGIAVVLGAPDHLRDEVGGRAVDQVVVPIGPLVGVVLLGSLVATLAAAIPARSAARVPTLQAIAGRRPSGAVPRVVPLLGVAAVVGGCALLAWSVASDGAMAVLGVLAGSLAVLAGCAAVAPWVLGGLARMVARAPTDVRLAGRSVVRNRARSSAVVAAIVAVMATLVAGATLGQTSVDVSPSLVPDLRDDQVLVTQADVGASSPMSARPSTIDEVVEDIEAVLDGSRAVALPLLVGSCEGAVACREGDPPQIEVRDADGELVGAGGPVLATPEVLDLFSVPPELVARLSDGVLSVQPLPEGSMVSIPAWSRPVPASGPPVPDRSVTLAGSFSSAAAAARLPQLLVSAELAPSLGLVVADDPTVVVQADRAISGSQRRQLGVLIDDLLWDEDDAPTWVELPAHDTGPDPASVKSAALLASLVLVLGVVGVGLALGAKDGEDEHRTLWALGASPGRLRRLAAGRAALLTGVGVTLAVPAGLAVAASIHAAVTAEYGRGSTLITAAPFRPDGWTLVLVVASPLLLGAVVFGATWVRDLAGRTPRDGWARDL